MTELVDDLAPDLANARQTASMAHAVVIRLKEMGLPEELDEALGVLCTDLGDIWGAQKALAARLEYLIDHADDWEAVADCLVDIRAAVDHLRTHVETARDPIDRVARYAYGQAHPQPYGPSD